MTTIDRSDENHRLIGLRHPPQRCIVRAAADVEEAPPLSPGNCWLGESDDGGTGESSGDAST